MKTTLYRALMVSSIVAGSLLSAAPAFAQDAPPKEAETADSGGDIIVTGSRIARPDLVLSSPVSVISEAEFNLRQPSSVEALLRDIPGTPAGINPGVNNGTNGTASFNLRGLGANRNLVLLNGRRVVPATLGNVVDLNIIPVALIKRADVLTGGAVTSYGADAVAGLVNFITDQNFKGVDFRANYGISERGDGANFRFDLTTGADFADGRGNVVLGLSYTKTDPVLQGDRALGLVSRASTTGLPQGSNTAVPASLFSPLPTTGPFAAGARFDPATGTIVPGLSDFNFNPLNYYQTPLDRYSIYGASHYELVPNVEVYAEAFYVRSRVTQNLAPTGSFTNVFQVPLNNQFLSAAQQTQLCSFAGIANCAAAVTAGTEIPAIVARRFVESGPRIATITSNVFQINAGLRGKLIGNFKWDAFVQYGETSRTSVNTNTALFANVQAGLRNCPAGSPAGCVPVNLFGAAGSISQAQLNFIGIPTSTFVNTAFTDVQGTISGDFGYALPFTSKPISVAGGIEYRNYSGGQFGDLPSQTPGAVLGSGGAFNTINGAFNSTEVFGEINLPVVEDRPFIYDLNIDAGIRFSRYSTSGNNLTYKFGGNYAPIPEIKFRGSYTRAVRAANLGELFSPVSTGLNNLAVDPCQGANGTAAAISAICVAQLAAVGLPASRNGSIPAPIAGQINTTGGGNPLLAPEVATTYSAGIVFQGSGFLKNLTATVDWYQIDIAGAISSPTIGDIVNGCFSQSSPTDIRCTAIRRNPLTGGLSGDPATTLGVITQSSNLGTLQTRGVDFTVGYSRDFGPIGLNWFFNGNYTDRSRFQATPSSFNRECVNYYSVSCDPVLPQWTWNLRTTATYEQFNMSLRWRHLNPVSYEPRTSATQPAAGTVGSFGSTNPASILPAYRQIPAYNYLDLSAGVRVNGNLSFNLTVDNLLDLSAPDVGNTIGSTSFNSGNTFPSLYDTVGRRFTMSARVSF